MLYGEIIGMKGGVLKARAAESLSNPIYFKWGQVEGFATEEPVTVTLKNGESVTGIAEMDEPGFLKLKSDLFEKSKSIELKSIVAINAGKDPTATKDAPDEVFLKDGSHISGKVVSMEDENLKVETPYTEADDILIHWEDVDRIVTKDPLTVEVWEKDVEERDEDKFEATTRQKMKTVANTEDFSLSNVRTINIPERRYDGAFDMGGSRLAGNTNTAALNASLLHTIWTKHHRFHIDGKYNFASADNVETANNARLNLRYDYFFSKKMFMPVFNFLEQDQFQGLNARATLGLGLGYQFFDKDSHKLAGYTGPAWVYENFVETGTTVTPTWAWGLRWEKEIWSEDVTVFHNQQGYRDFGDQGSQALRLVFEQGIRVEVYGDLYLKLEFDWRFNSQPEPGKLKSDESLIWGLGYNWSN
ncbi:MAG: DUF481 domain-containing protein [Nitrospirota bacterium]|nr:MAG: DUF481 domain-containing protein [Nitrospirota bacterium]